MPTLAFGQSKYYVDNLSENVKRGIREKLRRGIWPKQAPLGYYNDLKIKTIEVDPEKSKIVKKAFEKFTEGNVSFSEIARIMFRGGLVRKGNGVLKVDQVKNMLSNQFYTGFFLYSGELYKGSHKTYISRSLFNNVQKQMRRLSKPRIKGHNFPFTGFIRCAECGSAITAETHLKYYKRTNRKVVYNYYRCTKSLGSCRQKYIREEEIEKQIRSIVSKSSVNQEGFEIWERMFEEDKRNEELSASQRGKELEAKISSLEDQEETLLDGYINHIIEPEVYKKKKNEIFAKKLEITDQKGKIGQQGVGRLEPLLEFMNMAKTGDKIAHAKNNLHDLANHAKNAGSNFFLDNRQLKPELKKGFDTLFFESYALADANKSERLSFWAGLS